MTDTKHECVLLDFTPIESAVYEDIEKFKPRKQIGLFGFNAAKLKQKDQQDPLRELCCKLDSDWGESLTEIRSYFIQKKTKDIHADETVEKTLQKRFVESKQLLANKISSGWDVYEARKFINEFPTKIDEAKKRIATHKKIKAKLEGFVSVGFCYSNLF